MRLPHLAQSRIALIGSTHFPDDHQLHDLPAVANNLQSLRDIFVDPTFLGIPAQNCQSLYDPVTAQEVDEWLVPLAQEADDVLLVYYAGHGVLGEDDELYLTVRDSAQEHIYRSGVPLAWVKNAILNSPAKSRILILDCCFSGNAFSRMGASASAALRQVDIEGTHVLTATGPGYTAKTPDDQPLTAFTGQLVELLNSGIASGPQYLSIGYLFPFLEGNLVSLGLPRPHQQTKGTASHLGIARNMAFDITAGNPGSDDVFPPSAVLERTRSRPSSSVSSRDRVTQLRELYPRYSPRAYDRLAAFFAAEGRPQDVKYVRAAKARHLYKDSPVSQRIVGWFLRVLVGYGYHPFRLVGWYTTALLLGAIWFSYHELQPVNEEDNPVWNPTKMTMSLLFPMFNLASGGVWRPDGHSQWISVLLQLAGWVFAAAAVAGIVKRQKDRD
ncbi:caspase family protein [Saccharopolyspora sp. NPDC002578]